ncbi:MAG: serine/threonine-protein kinase [Opitutales bacterium]
MAKPAGFVPPKPEQLAVSFPQLEILEFIGQGGMGAVYKARQPALDRLVALKILTPQVGDDPGFAERFTREARALALLSHPNIVAVHDFGQSGGFPYFIMEYVDGLNLRQIERAGKLAPREALQIIPQICEALQFAHDEGIVHRDIKPENILVDKRGRVKIADFGLAKLLGRDLPGGAPITEAGHVIGTPHYMAPEQVEHPLEVDHRADIYSLGVVFYEMLTGELPLGKFAVPSQKAAMDQRLDDVVLRALEKEPQQRYQQASEVKTAVETIAGAGSAKPEEATAASVIFRWYFWFAALGLALAFLGTDSVLRMRTIAVVTDTSLKDAPQILKDPDSLTGYQFNQHELIIPAIGTDGYAWMMESERMLAGLEGARGLSGNQTTPAGGEARWNSSLHWLVLSLAWAYGEWTGQPRALGIAWAAPWANTLVLAIVIAVSVPVLARRFGAAAAALLALGYVAIYPYYEFFIVGYFYEHGLTATLPLLSVLCLVGGGGSWVRNSSMKAERLGREEKPLWSWLPEWPQARRWFVMSALMSGVCLWIGPEYELLVLAGIGVGAVLGAGWLGRGLAANSAWRPEPSLWRLWGQVGALTSVIFPLVDYLPATLGSRVESVLLSLAWLGAGDFIARACWWLNGGQPGLPGKKTAWQARGMVLDLALMALLPVAGYIMLKQNIFLGDSFLWRLDKEYVIEYRTLFRQASFLSPMEIMAGINLAPLTVLLILPVLGMRGLPRPWKGSLCLVFFPALVFLALAFYQIRYLGVACAMALGALATLVLVVTRAGPAFRWGLGRAVVTAIALLIVLLPYPCFTIREWISSGWNYPVTMLDDAQIITRDVSYCLRQRQGAEPGVVLSGPTTTTWMMFFGGFDGLGTISTEDPEGIKAAAAIYNAATDDEALALAKKYGITDVVIFSWDPFAEEYDKLADGLGPKSPAPPAGFVERMLKTGHMPNWLRPVPYKLPDGEKFKGQYVLIGEVDPEQTPEEAAVRMGQYDWAMGDVKKAREEFEKAANGHADDLPAQIALANFLATTEPANAEAKRAFGEMQIDLSPEWGTGPANLSFSDLATLAAVMLKNGDDHLAGEAMKAALAKANEQSVRRLLPSELSQFLQDLRTLKLTSERPEITQLTEGLLGGQSAMETPSSS